MFKLPSLKNKPVRTYIFLGLHLFFVLGIIVASALPRGVTVWMNDVAGETANAIINKIKGVKPVRPERLEIGDHTHTFYEHTFDDGRYKIAVGDSFNIEIKQIFPEGTKEELKDKNVVIKSSDNNNFSDFTYLYEEAKCNLNIYARKVKDNNYITFAIPKTNYSLKIEFDIIGKIVPKKENIYLSNLTPKLGSSFYISSLYLEPYEDQIVQDGYSIRELEDSVYGGVYYTNRKSNVTYNSPMSETKFRNYLDLSNHEYIVDDSHIEIDPVNEIVKINEGTRIGEHKITSNYGGEISFNVVNENASPLVDDLSISSTDGYVLPEQFSSSYVGQTIFLNGSGLKEHALVVKSSDTSICLANIKKSFHASIFNFKNSLFLRGDKKGTCNLEVYYYDDPSIKLETQEIRCDTFDNHLNCDVELYFDDVLFTNQKLEKNKEYDFLVRVRDRTTHELFVPEYLDISNFVNYYSLTKVDTAHYKIAFVGSGEIKMHFSFHYKDTYCPNNFTFDVVDTSKSAVSNVDPKTIRKSLGHSLLHLLTSVFLMLFLYNYLPELDKKKKLMIVLFLFTCSISLAFLSELIQLFIPGRCFDMLDVLIDIAAPIMFQLTLLIVVLIKYRKKPQQEQEKNRF